MHELLKRINKIRYKSLEISFQTTTQRFKHQSRTNPNHDQSEHGNWAEGRGGTRDGVFPTGGGGGGGGIQGAAQISDLASRARNLQKRGKRSVFADKRKRQRLGGLAQRIDNLTQNSSSSSSSITSNSNLFDTAREFAPRPVKKESLMPGGEMYEAILNKYKQSPFYKTPEQEVAEYEQMMKDPGMRAHLMRQSASGVSVKPPSALQNAMRKLGVDGTLGVIYEMLNYNGKPKIDEWNNLSQNPNSMSDKNGPLVLYRSMMDFGNPNLPNKFFQDFLNNDTHRVGEGSYGWGTYFKSRGADSENTETSNGEAFASVSQQYGGYTMSAVFDKDAVVANQDIFTSVKDENGQEQYAYEKVFNELYGDLFGYLPNYGIVMALLGYDAYQSRNFSNAGVEGGIDWVVLNRGILTLANQLIDTHDKSNSEMIESIKRTGKLSE